MKNYHALLLPLSAGFTQLDDRLLYNDDGATLVFESREDAQRYLDSNDVHEFVNAHNEMMRLDNAKAVIEPVSMGLTVDPSATSAVARLDGLEVSIIRDSQGKSIVEIEGPDDARLLPNGSPDIRIWLNEALIYRDGETGNDLNHPIFTGRQF